MSEGRTERRLRSRDQLSKEENLETGLWKLKEGQVSEGEISQ